MIYLREFAPSDKKVDHPNLYPYNTLSGKFIEPLEFSEVTVLYGNNGCGKSSLLNIIALKLGIRGVQNGQSFQVYLSWSIVFSVRAWYNESENHNLQTRHETEKNMGSSIYLNRKLISKRPRADVICEFTGMISSLGIQFEYENEHTLYLWKHSRPNGIRVYVDTAEPVDYPEPFGRYYREVFFDSIYNDEDSVNTDLLLEITATYMQKYPDALLFGECSPYLYYDKEDIDAVTAKPFDKEWVCLTKSHISPLHDDVYAQWREERRKS